MALDLILRHQEPKDERTFNFFSMVTTLGTPQDITLQEMRIECFFPSDAETDRQIRQLSPNCPLLAAKCC
jgi:hypothetical protein